MDFKRTWEGPLFDGHIHMGPVDQAESMLAIMGAVGIGKTAFVAIQNERAGNGLPEPLLMKAHQPDRFYVFAGLNHGQELSGGSVKTPTLAEQLDEFMAVGCDGIKMIEGKPDARRTMTIPITEPYFAEYWARAEELGVPIVWHVGDPEEFWDPDRIPGWAKGRNWGYGPEDVPLETLYSEVDEVLSRHPKLRVAFAHFYFLSADLPRAARFLDAHPGVSLDLAPGVEMLYHTSTDPSAARDFFIKYADRIVFGSDIFPSLTIPEAVARAGITQRWLETEDEFRVPAEADFLLGPPTDGIIRGMKLPQDVLSKIYNENMLAFAGAEPKPLDLAKAAELSDRIGAIASGLSGTPAEETEGATVAAKLREMEGTTP